MVSYIYMHIWAYTALYLTSKTTGLYHKGFVYSLFISQKDTQKF